MMMMTKAFVFDILRHLPPVNTYSNLTFQHRLLDLFAKLDVFSLIFNVGSFSAGSQSGPSLLYSNLIKAYENVIKSNLTIEFWFPHTMSNDPLAS